MLPKGLRFLESAHKGRCLRKIVYHTIKREAVKLDDRSVDNVDCQYHATHVSGEKIDVEFLNTNGCDNAVIAITSGDEGEVMQLATVTSVVTSGDFEHWQSSHQ